ncbi:hypothetical protein CK203_115066 [Vitis vinifera]|uniref:Uncharacterized protein n=1 Tax=Vitis vinifera TaxID=29760 RepID=A0A438EBU4_VITVI|nr:hypothetical protein CK203_115066 [Vitis vinifera]
MKLLHILDGFMSWDGYDDLPIAALLVEFRMPDIERYMGIRCPPFSLDLPDISWVFLILILTYLVQALYGIEDGIAKGLWAESSASDSKGKKPGSDSRPSDVGTIGMMSHRSSRRPQTPR